MDDAALDLRRHFAALRGLARINRASRTAATLWSALARWARPRPAESRLSSPIGSNGGPAQPISLLDIATGAGDIPIRLWHYARQAGLPMKISGCDVSPRALDFARRQADRVAAEVRFLVLDAVKDELPPGCDVITCSLFMHHLAEADAIGLLAKMRRSGARLVLVDDLARTPWGLFLAYFGSRVLTPCDVVHTDAMRSVRAAFTRPEAQLLACQAGLEGAQIKRQWPARWLLSWARA